MSIKIPSSCANCAYESTCATAMNMRDCRFYAEAKKVSIFSRLKSLFGKVFN